MHYMLMPLHKHFDSGFGATAEAFKKAAEKLAPDGDVSRAFVEHLPVSFLYRHATELFLKSGIVIFHRRLKLPFGTEPHNSEPMVSTAKGWKPFHTVHRIALLYSYWRELFATHRDFLSQNTGTAWDFPLELDGWIATIDKSDPGSTFFRYPMTKDKAGDEQKSGFKEATHEDIVAQIQRPNRKPLKAFIVEDENDEFVTAYYLDDESGSQIEVALRKTAGLLSAVHFALRVELAGGF